MILGIDHLAVNTSDLDKQHELLKKTDYECNFREIIPNSPFKKNLLNKYTTFHELAYYESLVEDYFPIELTSHGGQAYKNETPISFKGKTINLKVTDIDKEKLLWTKILDSPISNNIIKFSSLLPKRGFNLQFTKVRSQEPYTLDFEGPTCIALITKNIQILFNQLQTLGINSLYGPWKATINHKKMHIGMFRTYNNIIVELIQLEKSK